jgi:hypothetical protein
MKNRNEVINYMISRYNYKSYLEIGCSNNSNFNKINAELKEGIEPRSVGGTVKCTSDEFFIFNKIPFDIVFIDGMHECNQVVRDIDNSLKILNNKGMIILHDTIPHAEYMQMMPLSAAQVSKNYKGGWTGDVWKAVCAMRSREDIVCRTLDIETGLTFIVKEHNKHLLHIHNNLLNWQYFYDNKENILNIIDKNDLILEIDAALL